ncbi:MAG: AraC family transcriptional regulator, partial [Eudoraea sp.]|nr:AraC family transcriptional regulator [Eudoraea sp.]NNK30881.1 helix-turn-helix transcriptional regulator [Flavobacteriaceae bacterium]
MHEDPFIQKLRDILERHLGDENFGVTELAREVGLSRSQLHRRLKAINGKSTSLFIREYRLSRALEMLEGNVATVSEIAYKAGFRSPT